MGLDIVEFVMDVEEKFGLRIPNDVAATLTTPRKLIGYLHSQLPHTAQSHCPSQRAFCAIRRELAQRVGLPRSQLRPGSELLELLPESDAQAVWADIGRSLGYPQWPRARGRHWLAAVFLHTRPRTLGEAAQHVVRACPRALKKTDQGWSWHEVASVVDLVMRENFAISAYSLDDHFVEDLGLD